MSKQEVISLLSDSSGIFVADDADQHSEIPSSPWRGSLPRDNSENMKCSPDDVIVLSSPIGAESLTQRRRSRSSTVFNRSILSSDPIINSSPLMKSARKSSNDGKCKENSNINNIENEEGLFTGESFTTRLERTLRNTPQRAMRAESARTTPASKTIFGSRKATKTVSTPNAGTLPGSSPFGSASSALSPPSSPRLSNISKFAPPKFQLATKSKSVPARPQFRIEKDADQKKQKRREKAAAKEEEAQLRLANKRRTNRLENVKEMIADMSKSFGDSLVGEKVLLRLEGLDVPVTRIKPDMAGFGYIQFRRKVTSRFDDERDIFIPTLETIGDDPLVIVYVTAQEVADHGKTPHSLLRHINGIQEAFSDKTIIYLVEGYAEFTRKQEKVRNRQITAELRRMMTEDGDGGVRSSSQLDQATLQTKPLHHTLLVMSIEHGFRVVHSNNDEDTAEWIANLAIDGSSAPYKRRTTKALHVKSGSDVRDTMEKMLGQVTYVTPSIASSIASVYPNANALIRSVRRRGRGALEGITEGRTGRKVVNKAVSGSLAKLFSSMDENEVLME